MPTHDDDDDAGLDWLNAQLGDDEPENESENESENEPENEPDDVESDAADAAEAEADASDDSDDSEEPEVPEKSDVEAAAAAAPVEPAAVIDAESDAESDSESDPAAEDTGDFVWDLKPTVPTGKRPAASVTPAEPEPVFIPEPAGYSAPPAPTEPSERTEPYEPSGPLSPSELAAPPAPAAPGLSAPAEPPAPAPRIVLEPEPWWTTPVQSPLVPTADEVAAASERLPELVEPTTDAQPIVPQPPAEAPMPLDAPGGFAPFSSAGAGLTPGRPASRGAAPRVARILGWTAAGLLAVGGLIALFMLGQQLVAGQAPVDAPATSAAASATPTPTPTPTEEATGPQPVGVHAWDALRGGECLEPYTSPWEETFTVVACDTPHGAELVYRGVFEGEPDAAFPGEDALAAQINVLCSAPGVIDLDAAEDFPDLQVQGSYPVTEEQWSGGQRDYSCFVSRSSGEPLTASVAGPGPAA